MNDSNSDLAAQKTRVRHLVQRSQFQEARTLCADISLKHPDDAEVWNLRSSISGMLGDIGEAESCCRRAIELRPGYTEALVNLGNVLFHQERYEEAIVQYRTVLWLEPGHVGAQANAAHALSVMGRHGDAEVAYRGIAEVNPGLPEARYDLAQQQMMQNKYLDAVRTLRAALDADPGNPRVGDITRYGPALLECSQAEELRELFETLCRLRPSDPEAWFLLSSIDGRRGDMEKAAESARRAIALQPDFSVAHMNLAKALASLGRHREAVAEFRIVLQHNPGAAAVYGEMGNALAALGEQREAEAAFMEALRLDPVHPEFHFGLANLMNQMGRHEEAAERYREAIRLRPDYAGAYANLGSTLYVLGQVKAGIGNLQHAVELDPGFAEAYDKLAFIYREIFYLDAAGANAGRALELNPESAAFHYTMANIYHAQGRIKEAIEENRRVLELEPDHVVAHSALLMCMEHRPEYSAADLLEASREWAARHVPRDLVTAPLSNEPDPRRRLRIGYVSADFHRHPVGYYMEPLLVNHDRTGYEIFCYYNFATADEVTERLRASADHWCEIVDLPDEEAARRIREDGIDILVDLAGHSAQNRLLTFARRAAPVQATWMGYFDTTGLEAMDYIIGDRIVIPPGDEGHYVEKAARLPGCYMIFAPPHQAIEVSPLPALTDGRLTFGCFNNPAKVTEAVIDLWAEVLKAVPEAELYMKYKPFEDEGVCRRYRELLAARGVDPQRLRLSGFSPRQQLLEAYRDVDVALDSFPYTGGITTFEALWMGVPVITLPGERFVSRMAASILTNTGLEDFVADSPQAYIDKAVAAAADLPRLAELRAGLRGRMEKALCDGPGFTRSVEALYREMWTAWCDERGESHGPQ